MTTVERLTRAVSPDGYLRIDDDDGDELLRFSTHKLSAAILAADPDLAADIETGAAIRRLHATGRDFSIDYDRGISIRAWRVSIVGRGGTVAEDVTLAAAAEAALAALEEER